MSRKRSKRRYLDNQVKHIRRDKKYLINKTISIKDRYCWYFKKKKNNILKYIILFVLLLIVIYLFIPKIILDGEKEITISYQNKDNLPGYKGYLLFNDITNDIVIDSNIIDNKIGEYYIDYTYKYAFINFKKRRIVHIIDDINPEINVDRETIKACSLDALPEISYNAIDEYDGNITDKVQVNYYEDKVILSVSDNSNNISSKELSIDLTDEEAPIITLNGNKTIYLNIGSSYKEPGYNAYDNCDGDLTDRVEITNNIGSNIGTYHVKYQVSDNYGNITEEIRTVIIKNNSLYNSGSIGNGEIYLTFDDGPSEGTTNVILDILKEEGIKATFFVTCSGPDYLIKRIYDEGHTVALHTCTHEYSYVYSSIDNYYEDLNRISNRVKNIIGIEPKIIRFPGGSSNTVSRNYTYGIMSNLTNMVLEKGYRYFDWNVDSKDAGGAKSSGEVYYNVINNLSYTRSNVVLMHDVKYTTRDALRDIINYGKNNGFTFKQIDMNTYMIRHGINN